MPFWVYHCEVKSFNTETEQLHRVVKDIHSTKKFLSFLLNLNFTKRGETFFGECSRLAAEIIHENRMPDLQNFHRQQ